jgi:hypothetical protein
MSQSEGAVPLSDGAGVCSALVAEEFASGKFGNNGRAIE